MGTKNIAIYLPKGANLYDLGSILQVFTEAKEYGLDINIVVCSDTKNVDSAYSISINNVEPLQKIKKIKFDFLFITSTNIQNILNNTLQITPEFSEWVHTLYKNSTTIISVCNASFILGNIGLLDAIKCTTHWKRTDLLKEKFPKAIIQEDILFTVHNNIITSAGSASGVDLALHIIAKITDNTFAHKIAREMVVYNRRSGEHPQESDYLKHRHHLHKGIHKAQDFIDRNIDKKIYLHQLTDVANMSERNFCRVFKREVSLTVFEYINKVRKEKILNLLESTEFSKQQIANKVGLESERHLHRILKKN
ncbi:MAG TPA: DJ-1/PfpI family protein [Chitinophagales bacterium]|nr:DJ-1/PfpI family protein [Chitinophagales bacterium]HMZ95100.1 DJ-1/PfpI family protein [Chitinophagales bacterium]HNC65140.1 DJ-1/PfpI family protein [Chitinophagales bacterium]HND46228.1 DJ-1/PfpI family protein [Chitinophagales bacterium]HNE87623.1 DJ-1/PfpI family protein [Chitinophagales bacterium]